MHAPRSLLVVYRQGPGSLIPTPIFREITNQGVRVWLRADGTALVQGGNRPRPRLAFPDGKRLEIALPGPAKWDKKFPPSAAIGNMWLLWDVVVYSRNASPGHLLVGFFRIDSTRQQIVDSHVSLEVAEKEQEPAWAAGIDYNGPLFRAGDLVFWTNQGSSWDAAGPWKERKVRAQNLKSNTITDATEVPPEALRPHRAALMNFLEQAVQAREEELEIWALSVIGQVGTKDDLARLTKLELRAGERKPLYAKAIAAISSR